jgi:putative transposase
MIDEMERKIISLFALGNSYQNIREHLVDRYGMEVSFSKINAITDRLVPELRA